MDSFFSNPHLEGLFPRDKVSPTPSLLLTEHKGDEHAVVAMASALRNGWLDIRELSTQKDGVPALAHWMRGFDPLRSSLNHNYQWPVKGTKGGPRSGQRRVPLQVSVPREQSLTGRCGQSGWLAYVFPCPRKGWRPYVGHPKEMTGRESECLVWRWSEVGRESSAS